MDKIALLIHKWNEKKETLEEQRQEAVMAGIKKKDLSAMDAYIVTFGFFINDLYKLRE